MAYAHDHRDARGTDRARDRLLVELPQIFEGASAAHQEQHVAFRPLARHRKRRGNARRRAFALHRHGVDDDRNCRIAPRERRQHVSQRRCGERSDDAYAARIGGRLALHRLVEQAFAPELLFQPQKALVKRPETRGADRFHRELETAARLIQRDQGARLDQDAVPRRPIERRGAAAEHHAVDLAAAVLEGEIPVPGSRPGEVGKLSAHPKQGEAALQRVADAAQQFGDGEDAGGWARRIASKVGLHRRQERQASLH